jgi:cytochrome b subunit of formate dehydrogenase
MKRQQFLLVTLGLILLVSGASMLFTLWASSFSDFMALEDLGLDLTLSTDVFAELTSLSSGERYLAFWSIGSMVLGLIALIVCLALKRKNLA